MSRSWQSRAIDLRRREALGQGGRTLSLSSNILLGYDSTGNRVTLPHHLLNRHVYVTGRSGSGKSKFMDSLCRQLLATWGYTGAGMLLLDPHAELYASLTSWLAASGLDSLPITPLDLRANWVCALNVLRPRPGHDPAPLIHAAVRAILHGWKQADATETPRLAKWLTTLLNTLYTSHCTLLEALDIIRSREIRTAMARQVEDVMAKSVWMASSALKEPAFQEELESTMNRLGKFLATRVLRLTFSQSDVSLDMLTAMQEGRIVLAALATEGSLVDEDDAAVVGSLLINEVFCAAKHRGKRSDGMLRPFTVIVDEFQHFVSPVIAQSLAQLRGMGIGFVMANQSPQHLLDLGPIGKQVLNAVVSNTMTQIVFHTGHPADVDQLLTPWLFRNSVDPNQIKFQPVSTKVLGHDLKYLESTSHSITKGTSTSTNWSTTESVSHTTGKTHSHSQSKGLTSGTQQSQSEGTLEGLSSGTSRSHAESIAKSEAAGSTDSHSSQRSRQRSSSDSESRHLDGEYDALAKIIGAEPVASFDAAFKDEDQEHRALHRSIAKNAASSTSEGGSESQSRAATRSNSEAKARQDTSSESQTSSIGESHSQGTGQNESTSLQTSDSLATSESLSESLAETIGGAVTESESVSEGITSGPMLFPVMGQENLPPIYRSVEEQLFIHSQRLSALPDRHAIVKIGTTPPQEMVTLTVAPAAITAAGAQAWIFRKLKALPFALSFEEAKRRLDERRNAFEQKYLGTGSTDEPETFVRRITEPDHG